MFMDKQNCTDAAIIAQILPTAVPDLVPFVLLLLITSQIP